MEIIVIKTQEEMDALPERFETYTRIQIKASAKLRIVVRLARENSSVEARENSSVEARENSSVEARENSSVEAWGNSSVVAWGNSSVVARENSSVEAWGNSSVEAWENSSAVAWGNCVVRIFSAIKLKLKQFSVGICIGCEANLEFKAETAHYIQNPEATYNKEEFLDIYAKNIQPDGRILLHKSVRPDDGTDFYTGTIKYEGIVKPERWDPDENLRCGDGLHLSPTAMSAKSYNNGKIIKCLVKPEDFVVYPHDISKVRCREVEVLAEDE